MSDHRNQSAEDVTPTNYLSGKAVVRINAFDDGTLIPNWYGSHIVHEPTCPNGTIHEVVHTAEEPLHVSESHWVKISTRNKSKVSFLGRLPPKGPNGPETLFGPTVDFCMTMATHLKGFNNDAVEDEWDMKKWSDAQRETFKEFCTYYRMTETTADDFSLAKECAQCRTTAFPDRCKYLIGKQSYCQTCASSFNFQDVEKILGRLKRKEAAVPRQSAEDGRMVKCTFCPESWKKNFTVVGETTNSIAFEDTKPGAATHYLVVPKKHTVNSISDASQMHREILEEMQDLGENILPKGKFGYHVGLISQNHIHMHALSGESTDTGKYSYIVSHSRKGNGGGKGWGWFPTADQADRILANGHKVGLGPERFDTEETSGAQTIVWSTACSCG